MKGDFPMIKVDVCLESVFNELPYEERIKKIAEAGYKHVEFWYHDNTFSDDPAIADKPKDANTLLKVCKENGITINNMVVNASDGSLGGAPIKKTDLNLYLNRLNEVIAFCKSIECSNAITCSGNIDESLTRSQMRANLEEALGNAAQIAEKHNFTLFLEPLNTYVDHEGYYLDSSDEAAEIVRAVNSPSLKLLYDVYHMQIMEGNIISNIESKIDIIGHFHAAGVPGRGEIYNGELNYAYIIKEIEKLGYKGAFGLEYFPKLTDNSESLKLTLDYIRSAG